MSKERPHDELYWSLGPRLAIRDLDYKLATDDGKTYRLFDLANDRSEERNLMESKPALANRLRKKLHNRCIFPNVDCLPANWFCQQHAFATCPTVVLWLNNGL